MQDAPQQHCTQQLDQEWVHGALRLIGVIETALPTTGHNKKLFLCLSIPKIQARRLNTYTQRNVFIEKCNVYQQTFPDVGRTCTLQTSRAPWQAWNKLVFLA